MAPGFPGDMIKGSPNQILRKGDHIALQDAVGIGQNSMRNTMGAVCRISLRSVFPDARITAQKPA